MKRSSTSVQQGRSNLCIGTKIPRKKENIKTKFMIVRERRTELKESRCCKPRGNKYRQCFIVGVFKWRVDSVLQGMSQK